MEVDKITQNSATLEGELTWLATVIETRLKQHFENDSAYEAIDDIVPPDLTGDSSSYATLITEQAFRWEDRLALILALTPQQRPHLLDVFYLKNSTYDRGFTEFGGIKGKNHGGFLPTGETALFLLAGHDLDQRIRRQAYLLHDSPLIRQGILRLELTEPGEPLLSGALTVTSEYATMLTTGERSKPDYSPDFPASLVTTPLNWDDLVLDDHVLTELQELLTWLEHQDKILQNAYLSRHLKPGYRALFYGPPGTGKTLTACLLGKVTGHDVYKIDLSMIASKYIGETEKNLARVFDLAQSRKWILFFDEADALFGKRTATASANDRYANQEVSYLLQRIEDFTGVIVLASNLKANLYEAFSRRFQAIIHFPIPSSHEREQLWRKTFHSIAVADDVNFSLLAEKYTLAGGSIINVLRYCVLTALSREEENVIISLADVVTGIKRELAKEGKT
ncbi:ATP-binding protein [Nostoc sp. CHAB 5834]|nr:ATP-binding protein [Nostoc sp. CHAB 5834]